MKSLAEQMSVYQQYHQKTITKITHFIGVPLIVFSLLILFSWIDIRFADVISLNVAWTLSLILVIYYLILDWQLGLIMSVIFLALNIFASIVSQPEPSGFGFLVFSVCFILGWLLQLIGHYFEHKKPAFMENFFQIFIAPIFLVAEIAFLFGYKQDLKP